MALKSGCRIRLQATHAGNQARSCKLVSRRDGAAHACAQYAPLGKLGVVRAVQGVGEHGLHRAWRRRRRRRRRHGLLLLPWPLLLLLLQRLLLQRLLLQRLLRGGSCARRGRRWVAVLLRCCLRRHLGLRLLRG
jgi:hypothetical protein